MFSHLFILTSLTYFGCTFADVLVKLPKGTIAGVATESFSGKPYYSFQKIPYAAPPIGDLRFKAPVPPASWNGTLYTTYLDVICYQVSADLLEESEDCLYTNVFTPDLPNDKKNVSLPVLVYIYGGGFIEGHAMIYRRGPEYLINHDIVIVTFNYRLGPFGFLSAEDKVIPGNNGLRDQQLALKWVQENIQFFGGDPTKVTISGESAGGVSVGFQLLSGKSEGLFRGAILESGTTLSPWAIVRNARQNAFAFGTLLNNTFSKSNDSQLLLEYLRSVPAQKLDDASTKISGWGPVIEVKHPDAFVAEKMYVSLISGNVSKVPIIIGINSEEAIADAKNLDEFADSMKRRDEHLEELVPPDMRISNKKNQKEFGNAIRQLYCGNGTFAKNLGAGVRYNSDNSLTRPSIRTAEIQSYLTDVYFYQFSYDGVMGNVSIHLDDAESVAHAEEVRYLWRTTRDGDDNSNLSIYPAEDIIAHHRLLTLWTNFVKYSNPTPEPLELLQNVTWPTVRSGSEGDFLYLDIGDDLKVKNHPKEETYRGWSELYALLGYKDFDTY